MGRTALTFLLFVAALSFACTTAVKAEKRAPPEAPPDMQGGPPPHPLMHVLDANRDGVVSPEEIQGAADAFGVPVQEIAFLGGRNKENGSSAIPVGRPEGGSHCSHFAVLPSASEDGHVYVGQNVDCGPRRARVATGPADETAG